TRAMQDHTRLTVEALHRHEPHRRAPHRLADALGIAPVVLVALHVRLHIGRRHHPSLMPKLLKYPPPVMRTAARLHADHYTWWQLGEKLFQLLAPQLTSLNNFPRCINPVNLEHVLRQIQTNRANLLHGRSPCLVESTSPVWHTDAVGGRPHHLCERSEAIHRGRRNKNGLLRRFRSSQ